MADKLNAVLKAVKYFFAARHWKGHGIHSPTIFTFAREVLFDKTYYREYESIEKQIAALKRDKTILTVKEYGAGSIAFSSDQRRVADIAQHSGTSEKFGRLLYRIAHYYKPGFILELGTSVGISTFYLSKGAGYSTSVHTIEGNENLLEIARKLSGKINCTNINFHSGSFDVILPDLLKEIKEPALIYIDGNHTCEATLTYYSQIISKINKGFIIIDDIYWSRDMEKAWQEIKKSARLTIDLYSAGIIVKGDMLTPGHYKIRF
jgi:predicted O-methyltransferase YrrM